jgi:predicted transcriptional regulator with HTH domain
MKGVIADCLKKLVTSKFGKEKWEASLEAAGMPANSIFLVAQDIPDPDFFKLVGSICETLGITMEQAAEAFGYYWVNEYAPKIYKVYFNKETAKDFLLSMDYVHATVTKNLPNARPPRFSYEWEGDNTLIMHYKSERNMIDFMIGIIKGVGKYYNENLSIIKLGEDKARVVFSK